jgi:uncharacterized protein YutE (UPF0331/DUF86 family)
VDEKYAIRYNIVVLVESLVGLRNLLIHRYWGVEDRRVYQSLKANFKCVEEFLDKLERLLG